MTDDFTIVNVPIDQAVTAYCAWTRRLGHSFSKSSFKDSIDTAFASLTPLSMSMTKKLFVSVGDEWTAFFQNGTQGSDPTAGGHQLAMELGVIGMRICATPSDYLWQAVMWEVYAPQSLGGDEFGYRRNLAVVNDGGRWHFDNTGAPYPFEQQHRYSLRRKRDRFDRSLLHQYLREAAVNPYDRDVLSVSADRPIVKLEVSNPHDPVTRYSSYSYAEAGALHKA